MITPYAMDKDWDARLAADADAWEARLATTAGPWEAMLLADAVAADGWWRGAMDTA